MIPVATLHAQKTEEIQEIYPSENGDHSMIPGEYRKQSPVSYKRNERVSYHLSWDDHINWRRYTRAKVYLFQILHYICIVFATFTHRFTHIILFIGQTEWLGWVFVSLAGEVLCPYEAGWHVLTSQSHLLTKPKILQGSWINQTHENLQGLMENSINLQKHPNITA